jgi:TetR/AcrR family fatty acid metabolism transcriptional regulator
MKKKGATPKVRNRARPTFIEEARRRQILEASMKLFSERGYDQTSLADIATACGVSKGVVSYHFENKAQLGVEALRHILRQYTDFVRKRVDMKKSPRDKLLELPAACIDFVQHSSTDYLTYLDTLGSFGTVSERRQFMAKGYAGMRKLILDLIEEGQGRKEFAAFPAQAVADVLQAAIDGLAEQAAVAPAAIDFEACKRTLQKMIAAVLDGDISLARR